MSKSIDINTFQFVDDDTVEEMGFARRKSKLEKPLKEVLDKGKNIAYPRIVFDKDKDYDNRLHVPSSIRKEAKSKGYKIVTRMTADKSKFVIMREAI